LDSVRVKFVLGKVAMGRVFLRVRPFPPVSTIPALLHTHLHLYVVFNRRTKGRSLGTFQQSDA